MRWGSPLKAHLPRGGGYPTLQDFCAVYGIDLRFRLLDALPSLVRRRRPPSDQYTYIHMLFVCTGVSVCLCFVLYNVRAYAYVGLNVYKYKIMLINVNSFGYVKIVSYLCNVIKTKYY